MVNIPPIPPLLCSTPPPIDFGEDDDDVDVPTTVDCAENEFCDFLDEADRKIIEPLPSPRPSSVCDLPTVSIYDGLISPDEKDLTNHIIKTSLPPVGDQINESIKNNTKCINLTEAFNFKVKITNDDTTKVESETTKEPDNLFIPINMLKEEPNSHNISSKVKNVKDLTIESKSNSSQLDISCVQIEDIIDDLSDDELYSPKTPKNFAETNNVNDYFKIEEIKTKNVEENNNSKIVDSESSDFCDSNDSASLQNENGNGNDFKLFSSNSYPQSRFDMPPPLPDDENSITENDDDFGDFADFQETHFVNNTVPANDISINNHNELELNHVNEFKNLENESKRFIGLKQSHTLVEEFNDYTFHNSTLTNSCELNQERVPRENSICLEKVSQEISNDKNKDLEDVLPTNQNNESIECNKNNNFGDFNSTTEIDDNKFAEPSDLPKDCENKNIKAEKITTPNEILSNDDDEFDDFADFESHHEGRTSAEKKFVYFEVKNNANEEDDDFGDFNTAEPITPTAPSVTINKTSQSTTAETSAIPQKNLNERISKILELMFPSVINPAANCCIEPKSTKIKDIPFTSIDTAKALEFQWLVSDTRHSFIRSLAIDSKNILYGDNWNPSLPRFAANLSFNPLKPMKPVQASSSTGDPTSSILESTTINSSENNQIETSCTTKMETLDLNWQTSNAAEQTIEAFKDNNITPAASTATASMPYISNEPPITAPVSLTILENALDNEDKFSKTPPISEMESVRAFTSPLPPIPVDIELPSSQVAKNVDDFDLREMEENLKNALSINEVVVTSTFTGSFKETHIYTPPKVNEFEIKHAIATPSTSSSSPTKASPIDFDYEKAAMGVIIDEMVVKKEYRDVEYNSPFTVDSISKSVTSKTEMFETNTSSQVLAGTDININEINGIEQDEQESSDDFSEFQSVSSEVVVSAVTSIPKTSQPLEVPKITTVSHGGMILSPAILIPQAISMENQKPRIEWGDSTASINPEELARIEELFPEPKSLKSSNSSQKSTPTHQVSSTPSISATVANKELEGNITNVNDDDDDWSDFVSVTVTNNSCTNRTVSNNNILSKSPDDSPFNQRSPVVSHRMPPTAHNNSNYDDEWSEFVSSAPPSQQPNTYRVPQFNSGSWQNANFYNNPLSMYHKGPVNIRPTSSATAAVTHPAQKSLYNNNNNYNISQQPYQIANNLPNVMMGINQSKPNSAYQQQQVHIMQNFSTAPVPTPERLSAAAMAAPKNNQFQSIGSAKIAPSIALIPDLGFVAPAIPTHTSFINSLPKPSINMKK